MKIVPTFLGVCIALFTGAKATNLEGPFALFTKSSDPEFDSRVVNIGQRNGWFTIVNSIESTSDITPYNINFYLDFTFQSGSPSGWLVWGAVPPYSNMYTTIALIDPTTNIAPFYLEFSAPSAFNPATVYTTAFNFTSDGELKFENIDSRFYARQLDMPFYSAGAVFWLFGEGPAPAGYSPITLWKYQP